MPTPYTLPDLPYDYSALEPHISGEIMELHHGKHHAAYVKGANDTIDQMAEARSSGNLAGVNGLQKNLAFHLSGHVNHSVFWQNMSPDGGERPDGDLAAAIDDQFGGFDAFQAHFTAAAVGVQGSGWGVLTYDAVGQRLLIEQMYDQQNQSVTNAGTLLMCDVWEHAFYLQYKNVKPDYVKAWWNTVNWADVAARFAAVQAA